MFINSFCFQHKELESVNNNLLLFLYIVSLELSLDFQSVIIKKQYINVLDKSTIHSLFI